MATQTTQMAKAQNEKNNKVNQSIKAPKLRRNVGNANAARQAMAGRATSSARSVMPVNQVSVMVTPTNHKGSAK